MYKHQEGYSALGFAVGECPIFHLCHLVTFQLESHNNAVEENPCLHPVSTKAIYPMFLSCCWQGSEPIVCYMNVRGPVGNRGGMTS